MKCSVYIATSSDGYIATPNGGVDWLHTAGNLDADMGAEDMGFKSFIDSIDCMIMGRKCMDMISSMNLTPQQWPYGNTHIVVLSHSITTPPENLLGKVGIYSGDIPELLQELISKGYKHAYIDGGSTITSFLNLKLINNMTITKAPILLGEGIPLFGKLTNSIKLEQAESTAYKNDFVQLKYRVNYT